MNFFNNGSFSEVFKNMRLLITGGGGFVGSHLAEYFAEKAKVIVIDNLSRLELLKKNVKNRSYNWDYLKKFDTIKLVKGDVRNFDELKEISKGIDVIIHAAAQTAVTSSVTESKTDFEINALGTFNTLEVARQNDVKTFLYCSTNKVYGENVNKIGIEEKEKRYIFEEKFKEGLPEPFSTDLCEHTPYGCSKLTGDTYTQDYGHLYGLKTGVFRMSCIYGTRQFGFEDQGWISWLTIATILKKPITIFGDGKQVRDVLYVSDLVNAFDAFIKSNMKNEVFNLGGGPNNTLSLIELIDLLEELTRKRSNLTFKDWRPSDQKVYISNINKIKKCLNWEPKTSPEEGVKKLVDWVKKNKDILA